MKKILGLKLPTLRLFVLIFCVANQSAPDKPNIILHWKKLFMIGPWNYLTTANAKKFELT